MTKRTLTISNRPIGEGQKPFLIAEIAQAHDGSLGFAHAFIDAVADAGTDAVKFQTHIASAESTRDEQFRVPMSGQDATRYDYWRRMEFTPEQWAGLNRHAKDKGIIFLSSAFSVEAVRLLQALDMPAWKIGSGEFRSEDLLQAMIATKKPILYSTGMSNYNEIEHAVSFLRKDNIPFGLFQCTSRYPTALKDVGLNVISQYREKYDCVSGLSDHSGTPFPALAAMAQGADMIELHVTFDKRMYGPDTVASLTMEELSFVAKARDAFQTMKRNPVDKNKMAHDMLDMRDLFSKSIGLQKALPTGTILTEAMLVPKKPGTGIPFSDRNKIVGCALTCDVPADRLLTWKDIDIAS